MTETRGAWTQDPCDRSWYRVDSHDGTFVRVAPVIGPGGTQWAVAWTELGVSPLRLGAMLHATPEAAMTHVDTTIIFIV